MRFFGVWPLNAILKLFGKDKQTMEAQNAKNKEKRK